jgi:uncharacterized protein with von Willebrand factor type A (vWA) domain
MNNQLRLNILAEKCQFQINNIIKTNDKKRVIIALDYSGSMNGSKIKSAISNILKLLESNINDNDELMLMHFNNQCIIDFALLPKYMHLDMMNSKILALTTPSNSTVLYEAIKLCYDTYLSTKIISNNNDWIVVLTDGEDNGSKQSVTSIIELIKSIDIGIIIIGIGSDVNHKLLESFVQASHRGVYISASGDQTGISNAFGQVAKLIEGQVILEDV